MSFPINPTNGQQYTNLLGTIYAYSSADNAWLIRGVQGINTTGNNYSPVSRYSVVATSGSEVWCVSASTIFSNLNWSRSGTTLTIFRTAHGHNAGNIIIVRNTNLDYQVGTIQTVATDSFTINTQGIGNSVGTYGAYSLGFTYAHTSGNNGGVLSAPAGDHVDVSLLALRIRTGGRGSTTYDLVVPASSINGAGDNTSLSNCFMPDFNIRGDSDALVAVAATMITNISGSYTTFEFGNLGATSVFIIGHW